MGICQKDTACKDIKKGNSIKMINRLKFILIVLSLILCNCAVGFLTETPISNEIKSPTCLIGAINVSYHAMIDNNANKRFKNVVIGFHTELIKQLLIEQNIYCDSSNSNEILNIDIFENSYNRIAGIKAGPEISGIIYGLSLSLIPISTHLEYSISAKIGNSGATFKSKGKEMGLSSILLFPIAPFAKPSDKHDKLIRSIMSDVIDKMNTARVWERSKESSEP